MSKISCGSLSFLGSDIRQEIAVHCVCQQTFARHLEFVLDIENRLRIDNLLDKGEIILYITAHMRMAVSEGVLK
jgi:hypothetical protein